NSQVLRSALWKVVRFHCDTGSAGGFFLSPQLSQAPERALQPTLLAAFGIANVIEEPGTPAEFRDRGGVVLRSEGSDGGEPMAEFGGDHAVVDHLATSE